MLTITVNLKDSVSKIENNILRQLRDKLNSAIHRAIPAINRRVQEVCENILKGTREYQSLLSGELLAELGIPNVAQRVERVIDTIKENVEVAAVPIAGISQKSLKGGLTIKMLRSGYEDLLGLSEASYVSQPSGQTIPWLEWLLLQGDRVIVLNYDITYNLTSQERARSRSGMALMIRGRGWRVPPEFSGTEDSNFITRAFNYGNVEKMLNDIIASEIQLRGS